MFTTATLTISNFTTDLALTGDGGQPRDRINVIGDKGDDYWARDVAPYFRRNADLLLTERGYTRTGGWAYDAGRDRHVAPIDRIPDWIDTSPTAAAKAESRDHPNSLGVPR